MTILQTSSSRSSTSADLVVQRAQSAPVSADSALGFSSVLDLFTESEPKTETIDETTVSEEVKPADDSDGEEKASEKSTEIKDPESSGAQSSDIQGDEQPSNQTNPQPSSEQNEPQPKQFDTQQTNAIEQVLTAADLGILLSNAARVDLADLAKLQLEGQPQTKPVSQAPEPKQAEIARPIQKDAPSSTATPQDQSTSTKQPAAQVQFGHLANRNPDLSSALIYQDQVPTQEPVKSQPAVTQTHTPQVIQASQVVAADTARPPQPIRTQSLQNSVGVDAARSITSTEASSKANTGQSGLDLGARSAQAEKLVQNKSINDRPLMRREVMAQVQRGLASIMNTKGGTMRMRLNPDHLGDIKIELNTKDGQVRVKIDAANEDARSILKDGLEGLKHSMESRGVRVDDIRVNDPQQSAFDQMFKGTNRDSANSQQDTQQQGSHREDNNTPMTPEADLNDNTPQGIWTELGLDAIA